MLSNALRTATGAAGARASGTRRSWAASLHWNAASHTTGHAHRFAIRHLTWHATSLIDVFRLANLFRNRVRHFASMTLFDHRAGGIRHLARNRVRFIRANRIRHLSGTNFTARVANRVRNTTVADFLLHRANGVRHFLRAALFDDMASRVRHASSLCDGNRLANLIRHAAGLYFLHHACGHDRAFFIARHPHLLAGNWTWAMHLLVTNAAWAIDLSATVAVPFPTSWSLHAAIARRCWTLLHHRLPFAAAAIDLLAFHNRTAHVVAHVLVMRLVALLVSRVALVAVARLINGLANGIALLTVACLVFGLANGVRLVAVACLSIRHLHRIAFTLPSRLLNGLLNGVTHVLVARLIHGATSLVRFIAEMCFTHIAHALHGSLFANGIIDRAVFGDGAFVVHDVLHHLVRRAARACRAKVATGRTSGGGAARIARCTAIAGER